MLQKIVTTTGKRVYKKLPKGIQEKALKFASPHIYKIHTKGIVANSKMVEFVRKNPRPVSIVIPSYNDYPLLSACIESIYATCENLEYEIIVVDDYAQAANRELLKTLESDKVRLILKEEREGFAKAVNRGMSEAKYDILLLNSDIVAQAGWLEALQYSAYQIDPKIGMVSPKLVYPDGRIQYGGTYYARVLAPQWFGHLFVGRAATTPVANVPYYNRSISGACVYITRAVFDKIGVLDDEYWLGFEDVDYGLKAWEAGYRCYYQPASMLIHYESASRGYSQGKRELSSMRYFWSKWGDLFMHRTLTYTEQKTIDYVLSEASTPLWREYIHSQAEALKDLGYTTSVTEVEVDTTDEKVISKLKPKTSIKISADWGAQKTTWLSSLENGKPVYLLSGIESSDYGSDPVQQAKIISQYRPEFDYVTPNRWTTDQLRAESAWEAQHRLVPAIAPKSLAKTSEQVLVVVDATAEEQASIKKSAKIHGLATIFTETKEIDSEKLAELYKLSPRAVVLLSQQPNSLLPLTLMSLGGGFISVINDKTRYEVLDGYNALLIEPGDVASIDKPLEDILDDNVWKQLRENGFNTAQRYALSNAQQMKSTIESIARTAV